MNSKGQKLQNLAIGLGILAALCILLIPQTSVAQISVSVSKGKTEYSRNGRTTIKFNDWQKSYKIDFEGDFELSDNDEDIISVSRGGYFEITRAAFGSKRRVTVTRTRTCPNGPTVHRSRWTGTNCRKSPSLMRPRSSSRRWPTHRKRRK